MQRYINDYKCQVSTALLSKRRDEFALAKQNSSSASLLQSLRLQPQLSAVSCGRSQEWSRVLQWHGSLNVPIEHHPTIRYMVYNGYYKVMSNIPKMGHLPTPEWSQWNLFFLWCGMLMQQVSHRAMTAARLATNSGNSERMLFTRLHKHV